MAPLSESINRILALTCECIGQVFSRYDLDGSGSISESELLPAAKELGFVVVEVLVLLLLLYYSGA